LPNKMTSDLPSLGSQKMGKWNNRTGLGGEGERNAAEASKTKKRKTVWLKWIQSVVYA